MIDDRRRAGLTVLETLFGGEFAPITVSADLRALRISHLFSVVWARPLSGLRDRGLIMVAVNGALGRERQLRLHLRSALNADLSRAELMDLSPPRPLRRPPCRLHRLDDRRGGFRRDRRRGRRQLKRPSGRGA